jgi:hypothetical protein
LSKSPVTDSLPSLSEFLKEKFPNPPSLPTLKRWAAAGYLKACEVHRLSARPSRSGAAEAKAPARAKTRYQRERAIQLIRSHWDLGDGHTAPAALKPAEIATRAAEGDRGVPAGWEIEIAKSIRSLNEQVAANTRALDSVNQTLAGLAGVRTALMTKYDAANAQQAQIIEGLRQKISDLSQAESLSRDVQAVRMGLAKLVERIDTLDRP